MSNLSCIFGFWICKHTFQWITRIFIRRLEFNWYITIYTFLCALNFKIFCRLRLTKSLRKLKAIWFYLINYDLHFGCIKNLVIYKIQWWLQLFGLNAFSGVCWCCTIFDCILTLHHIVLSNNIDYGSWFWWWWLLKSAWLH